MASNPEIVDWEREGRRLGGTLDALHSVVVVGIDHDHTALVALGIARVQSLHRRVAVGDLLGEAEPLQRLVTTDDPHGIVDSFVYGVSLNRIAFAVPGEGDLFVMPTGTEPLVYAEILPNPRWRRLAAGFGEAGALLVLAAPADAAGVDTLVMSTDGAVVVGDFVPSGLAGSEVVASVRAPRAPRRLDTLSSPIASGVDAAEPTLTMPRAASPAARRRLAAAGGIALTLALVSIGLWLASRPLAGGPARGGSRRPVAVRRGGGAALPSALDGVVQSDSSTSGVVAAGATMPVPANRSDSATAPAFTIVYRSFNTEAGAILKLQQEGHTLPAATFVPVLMRGTPWFELRVGAFSTFSGADSLRSNLRSKRLLDEGSGRIVRAPLAFLMDSGVAPAAVPGVLSRYAARGRPVYALRQADGRARVYAGAFETPAQSLLMGESLRAAGVARALVYRTGRLF